jgi:hypothetical protein
MQLSDYIADDLRRLVVPAIAGVVRERPHPLGALEQQRISVRS